ncbi:MAG: tyrosine recombinase XerC [Faecalibacterium sp.]|nr:tyrosine recombinase XerC [Ruminococcus sp.]MCM1392302.1 tyrosine recombinase XerC [Ruminococcus sp.]MCM1484714.1 tyrosine recombinase XerC [Faecalibacterium sp.]
MPNYNASTLPKRVVEYLNYLGAIRDTSPLTVEGYARDLRLFFEYIAAQNGDIKIEKESTVETDLSFIDDTYIEKLTLTDIHGFLAYCNGDRKNSSVTRARKASSIRGFFKYVSDKMGYISSNPATQLQVSPSKKKLPKYLTLEQSQQLLQAVDGDNKLRDYCIITLFLNCGLRLAELVGLNLSDFNLNTKTLIVTGKGNKQRMLYLNKACVDSIKAYLAVRPVEGLRGDDRNALFISRLKKRMGRQAVQLMVYDNLKKIGLDGNHYSVHKLRHTAATLMYQYGDVDVLVLKDMLGHENLSTTEIYTHVENKQLREAAKKNPLSKESDDT